jgi:arabinose-5-phosphate isomerase
LLSSDQILKTGKKTLEIEVKTLQDLHQQLGESFVSAVEALMNCRGRVVVTGVGKSALIGQKIVSTFNSTGTHSIYMHAADAVHGDLGMIGREDVIVCLSKSGETAEIRVLIPIIRTFGNILIGITSNPLSYLASHADLVLDLPVSMEAEPNRLAPTASSIAQMAIGDALASALLKLRGFSHEHFARFHPGGSLGKQLYLRVDDVFPQNERPVVRPESPVPQVILEMTGKRLGMTAVCDPDDQVIGIITDGDLRRMLEKYGDTSKLTAADIMTVGPKTVSPGSLAVDAFRLMQQNSITQVIVADQGKYRGVVHVHDLIREGIV